MPIRTIGTLLGASNELKALSEQTRRLRGLQALYGRSAPRELARSSRVRNFKTGTLVVYADNAAVAAKLRQLAPTLLASLRRTDTAITGIRIEVQVSGAVHERGPKSKTKVLSPDAIEQFEALSNRVPEGSLKSALANLVRRHAREKVR